MITFTEQEKAVIMLGTASITEADGYGQEPTPEEMKFAQFVQRAIKPTQTAYQLFQNYFHNPVSAYSQIKNISIAKKRMIKTFFVYMCTCDGPINEGEQQALDLLDTLCDFPYMSMSEIENEYKMFLDYSISTIVIDKKAHHPLRMVRQF